MLKASRLLQSLLRANLLNSIFCNHGRTAKVVLPFSFHASGNVIPTSGRGPAASIKLLGAGSARTAHSQSDYSALLTRTLVAYRIRGTRSVSRRASILLIPASARTSPTQALSMRRDSLPMSANIAGTARVQAKQILWAAR